MGKSRLLAEPTAHAATTGSVLSGRCLSYGEGITYWPVVEIVEQAAGILLGTTLQVSAKLGALFERLPIEDLDQLRTIAAALANLVGSPQTPQGTYMTAEISQAELHWGIRRFFQLLAAERPLVVVLEDLHWAEPTLLDLIAYVVEDAASGPMLVLATGRPELQQSRPGVLAESDAPACVPARASCRRRRRGSSPRSPGRALASLADVAGRASGQIGGNPLFLEETVRMLVESGALADGGAELEDLPVPRACRR